MQVETIKLDRLKARELWQEYKAHRHYSQPIDEAIEQAYRHIAYGRTVIQALESIRAAGLDEQGLPRLALARADARRVYWESWHGGGRFSSDPSWRRRRNAAPGREIRIEHWPALVGDLPNGHAMVPIVPSYLRPGKCLARYHTLFEAVWSPLPPGDPYLLRHLGGDLWLVLAAWDLTPVERAAMATRVNG